MLHEIKTITLNPAFDLHYGMENFIAGKENYVQSVVRGACGKGINTSRALAVNGVPNLAYVVLGEENGTEFASQLTRDGVNFIPFYTAGRIRENITLHPKADAETRISLDTFALSETVLDEMESRLLADLHGGDLVSFSGRLPRGISKERVILFLKRLIQIGARVIVDSNSFTPDDLRLIHPWFIKPNEQEIEAFLDTKVQNAADAAAAARELVLRGVAEEVMISLGGDGAAWSDGVNCLHLEVPRLAHPVSTIGAGDSTLAGLLSATAKGEHTAVALQTAVSFGTAACMTEGTLPPRPEDIRDIFSKVMLHSF